MVPIAKFKQLIMKIHVVLDPLRIHFIPTLPPYSGSAHAVPIVKGPKTNRVQICWCFFMFTFSSFLQENSNKFKISLGLPLANMIISTSHPHPSFSGCTHAMPMRIIKGPKINGQNFDGVCFLFTSCLYSKNFT